ncbi:MAG: hypothetical protein AB3A66_28800 (plasmid) [Nodularia sp. CChRGM 3473]
MTHPIYSHQHLQLKSIARLKQIYSEIGCTIEVTDKRCKDAWINAIAQHQTTQLQKIDEQATAQAELDQYISEQAQAIAPEELTTVEINCHHFEIFAGTRLIAYISYDHGEFVTQNWVVMVNGEEKFRHAAISQCHRFIDWHHKEGTLNPQISSSSEIPEVPIISEISFYDQEASVGGELVASVEYDHDNHENLYWRVLVNNIEIFRDTTPARCHSYVKQHYQQGTLPVQELFVEEAGVQGAGCRGETSPHLPAPCPLSSSTGNEIMVQIFNECQKYGLELLDDEIYRNDDKLGQVGQTNGTWWAIRTGENQTRVVCDCAMDAVWWLSMTDTSSTTDKYLQNRPLEQLTSTELEQLFATAELVTA